jgi:APA family basic amino acid/polyamine antiporter
VTMVWGLVAAVAFYCLIVLSAGSMQPWPDLLKTQLPAVAAFSRLGPPRLMEAIILAAACVSLLKTWNAVVIFGSQLLVAQARADMIPGALSQRHPRTGTPARAIAFITAGAMAFILLGRGAVLPIVNMVSICLGLTFVISLIALLRLRRAAGTPPTEALAFRVPGGRFTIWVATVGAVAMAGVALIEPAIREGGVPVEWMLLAGWALLGAAFRRFRTRRAAMAPSAES